MTWISLVCLLALSSAVFGRSVPSMDGYGSSLIVEPPMPQTREILTQGYGQELTTRVVSPPEEVIQTRIQSPYGSSLVMPPITRTLPTQGYGSSRVLESGYGSSRVLENGYGSSRLLDNGYGGSARILEIETAADRLCRGQLPQTVIPIEGNRKFVVCLEDGKGTEQSCPKGLFYHEHSRRCERKLGPLDDLCASQPCLNGGRCLQTESSWQCECPAGFDGITCELDAQICHSSRPCGPDAICQSFRFGAALSHMCHFEGGRAYGFNPSEVEQNPCRGIDGPQRLTYTNKGFLICDGESMHVFSCPAETIWDDVIKTCTWAEPRPDYGGYGSSYGSQVVVPSTPKVFSGYGQVLPPTPKLITNSYGYGRQILPPTPKVFSGYGSEVVIPSTPKVFSGYGSEVVIPSKPKVFSGYGSEVVLPPTPKVFSGYGQVLPPTPKVFSGYGAVLPPTPKVFSGYGSSEMETTRVFEPKISTGYGGQITLPPTETRIIKTSGY